MAVQKCNGLLQRQLK